MKFFHIYDFLIFETRTTPGAEKPARQTNPQSEGFTHILEVDLALENIPHILEVYLSVSLMSWRFQKRVAHLAKKVPAPRNFFQLRVPEL